MAKQKRREKYQPDENKTLMTDMKRIGLWSVLSTGIVVVVAVVIEAVV
ncbi:hypothetical protein [Numidum massiliense]|nr:hypothetical protein [Numidum massiliense]